MLKEGVTWTSLLEFWYVPAQEEMQAQHSSCLVDLRGLRLLSSVEMIADAADEEVDDYGAIDEAVDEWQQEGFSLEGYSSSGACPCAACAATSHTPTGACLRCPRVCRS